VSYCELTTIVNQFLHTNYSSFCLFLSYKQCVCHEINLPINFINLLTYLLILVQLYFHDLDRSSLINILSLREAEKYLQTDISFARSFFLPLWFVDGFHGSTKFEEGRSLVQGTTLVFSRPY